MLKAAADQSNFLANFATGDIALQAGGAFIDTNGFTVGVSAALQGAGGLTKQGAGTLTLSGANSFTGATTVSAGTLALAGTSSLSASQAVQVDGKLDLSALSGSATTIKSLSGGSGGAIVLGAKTLTVNQAASATFAGSISGAGALVKEGAGTLILTGTNTYTGGTTINAGTLQIGNGGTTGSIVGNVVNNASLVFNRSDAYTFPGTISGSGNVTFTGGGTVVLSTPESYQGAIAVSDSTNLHLETGAVSTSTFSVENGGVISGNGTVGGLVVGAGGIAAPGNSPGTIAVAGPVNFNSGAVYRVDVTPQGQHDLITATGPVTISNGASVQVVAQPGVYAPIAAMPSSPVRRRSRGVRRCDERLRLPDALAQLRRAECLPDVGL